ncbi:MAG: fibronectin type III domain-containing protein [Verrucomicrobiota bacterium]
MNLRALFLGGLLAFLPGADLWAQGGINVPGKLAPSPKPKTIQVLRGESTRVVLEAASSVRRRLTFKIQKEAAQGIVSEPEPHPDLNTAAIVTYTPPADRNVTEDVFRYAVKEPTGSFSPMAMVKVVIVDPTARLEVPPTMHFGRLPLGESVMKTITLRNVGTADFRGVVTLPPPFFVVRENPEIVVPMAGQTRLLVNFVPDEARSYFDQFTFQEGLDSAVMKLSGVAFAPVELEPRRLELAWDPRKKMRSGTVIAENQMSSEITLTLIADDRIEVAKAVTIPPQGKIPVEFSIPATDKLAYKGVVVAKAGNHEQEIRVNADDVPAILALTESVGAGGLEFLREKGSGDFERKLRVKNQGGDPVFVFAEVEPPFSILEGSGSRRLEPGEELPVTLRLDTSHAGDFSRTLRILAEVDGIRVPLRALVNNPKSIEPDRPRLRVTDRPPMETKEPSAPLPFAEDTEDLASLGERTGELTMSPRSMRAMMQKRARDFSETWARELDFDPSIPSVPIVRMVDRSQKTLTIWWPHPKKGENFEYVVETEVRRVFKKTGIAYPDWYRFPDNVEQTSDERGVTAVISRLQPGTLLNLRVLTKRGDAYAPPVGVFPFATAKSGGPWFRWWMVPVAILFIAGMLKVRIWMDERGIEFGRRAPA